MVEITLSAPVTEGLSPDLAVGYQSLLDVHFSGPAASFSFEWNDIQPGNLLIFSNAQAPLFGWELPAATVGTDAWVTVFALPGYGGFTDLSMTTGYGSLMNVQFGGTSPVATPELSTWAMLLLGLVSMFAVRKRRALRHAFSA